MARLSALEISLGASLPEDYRAFLEKHQVEDEAGLYVSSNPDYWGVRHFFEIGEGLTDCQLDEVYRLVNDVLPPFSLPVAEDWAGNFYLLVCAGPKTNQVGWWNHERDEGDLNVDLVANSFTEFLGLLVRDET